MTKRPTKCYIITEKFYTELLYISGKQLIHKINRHQATMPGNKSNSHATSTSGLDL